MRFSIESLQQLSNIETSTSWFAGLVKPRTSRWHSQSRRRQKRRPLPRLAKRYLPKLPRSLLRPSHSLLLNQPRLLLLPLLHQ